MVLKLDKHFLVSFLIGYFNYSAQVAVAHTGQALAAATSLFADLADAAPVAVAILARL